ncbi:MAG: ABC transporter permease subunit [Planctomycetia bacterium]|nr:ABC transporter permease subunit [Planctomycetia bacterium]
MRPYLAIIKDSFREAMVSRTLWVLLALITIFLLFLAPLGINERPVTRYSFLDFVAPQAVVLRIAHESKAPESTPAKRIWELLGKEERDRLETLADREQNRQQNSSVLVMLMFNDLLSNRELYQAEYWKDVSLGKEAQGLIAQQSQNLSEAELARLNRLLLDAAFPVEIRPGGGTEVLFSYLGGEVPFPVPGSRESWLRYLLSFFTDYFLGAVGVLVAILVTATMVPRTFEQGSVDLLLSKPVSRSFVFLAKFFGGCAFVTLLAAYFIAALWLLMGVRYGFWHMKLWLCVPLMLFLFSIYYAVSSLAGLLWQNGMIAAVITIVFWAACLFVWIIKATVFEGAVLGTQAFFILVPSSDNVVGVQPTMSFVEWRESDRTWQSVKDPTTVIADLPVGMRFPMLGGTMAPFSAGENHLVLVTAQGIVDYHPDSAPDLNQPIDWTAIKLVGPPMALKTPFSAAMSEERELAIYDGETLRSLALKDGFYAVAAERKLPDKQRCVMGYGGDKIVLAFADGRVLFVDAASLKTEREFAPGHVGTPRLAFASADGRYAAVLSHDKQLWLYDVKNQRDVSNTIVGQGSVSAVTLYGTKLLVADSFTRVTEYNLDRLSVARQMAPALSWWEWAYWYPIRGIYTVFPKPGELGDLVQYIVTEKDTGLTPFEDLEVPQQQLNIWQPVWSNLIFVSVLLALGCWYVSRKDF